MKRLRFALYFLSLVIGLGSYQIIAHPNNVFGIGDDITAAPFVVHRVGRGLVKSTQPLSLRGPEVAEAIVEHREKPTIAIEDGKVLGTSTVVTQPINSFSIADISQLITNTFNDLVSQGKLKGDKGDRGDKGEAGIAAPYTPIQNGAPAPIPQVFIPGGMVPAYQPTNFPGASLFAATDISSTNFTTNIARVDNSLTVNGSSTLNGNLNVTGTISGNVSGTVNPGFTAGSVVFQGASGLAQDNSNFFWNSTNHRLGIGTATPAYSLDIVGDINTSVGYKIGGIAVLQNPGTSNIFVGDGAGQISTTTTDNTFLGYHAGNAQNVSCCDTFIGSGAGALSTSGYLNTFVGYYAGQNTTGNQNNYFGSLAGQNATVGGANNFFGNYAGYLTSGSSNSFFGHQAGYNTSTGQGNVAFGRSAGISNTTGSNNTFIGYNAGNGSTGTLTNATAIGYNTQVTASNSLILGNGASVGIGTTSPSYLLDVNGSGRFNGPVNFANGIVINSSGTSAANTTAADSSLILIGGGITNAGNSCCTVNIGGTDFGGGNSYFNTIMGYGAQTLGDLNGAVLIGKSATHRANNGSGVAVGRSSTTDAFGVALGFSATITGSSSIAIGSSSSVTGNSSAAFGASGVNGDNIFAYGGTSTKHGFGTVSPASKVQIVGTGTFGAAGVSALNLSAHTATLTTSPATFRAAEIGAMTLSASSAQTVTTASSLYISTPVAGSNVTITNNKPIDTATGAYLSSGGTWTNTSSRERKENFVALNPQEVLDKIDALSIERWNYKAEDSSITHIGPVAEEFHAAFDTGGIEGDKSISTIDPAGVALLGIQGLSEKIKAMVDFSWVIEGFKKFGVVIEQDIIKIKSLAVEKLQIGSADKPAGFVLYDKATKDPYCVAIENGEFTKTIGGCSDNSANSLPQTPAQSSTEQIAPTNGQEASQAQETAPQAPAPSEPQDSTAQAQ